MDVLITSNMVPLVYAPRDRNRLVGGGGNDREGDGVVGVECAGAFMDEVECKEGVWIATGTDQK